MARLDGIGITTTGPERQLSRSTAALLGGYVLSYAATACLARILPLSATDAIIVATLPAFIFYTATYTDERDRKFGLGLGAERFLVKPQEPEALLAVVREVVATAGAPARPAAAASGKDEHVFLKQYNEALVR